MRGLGAQRPAPHCRSSESAFERVAAGGILSDSWWMWPPWGSGGAGVSLGPGSDADQCVRSQGPALSSSGKHTPMCACHSAARRPRGSEDSAADRWEHETTRTAERLRPAGIYIKGLGPALASSWTRVCGS